MAYTEEELKELSKEYEYGFYTDISPTLPCGLNEDIVRAISKPEEPDWMTQWRLEALLLGKKWKNQVGKCQL